MQTLLDVGSEELCADHFNGLMLSRQLEVYLDCDFVDQYMRWTTAGSDWIDEARTPVIITTHRIHGHSASKTSDIRFCTVPYTVIYLIHDVISRFRL